METKRTLKKGVREAIIIVVLIIIAIFMGIIAYKHYTSDKYKLAKLGYTSEEVLKIIEINKQELFLNREYNDKLLDVLTAKYYLEKNLDKYLDYYEKHNTKDINDIIAIINVGADKDFYTDTKDTDLSKGYAILVNKFYKLTPEYNPDDIVKISNWYAYEGQKAREEVYTAYKMMFNAAKKENLTIIVNDSYRTLEEQQKTWERYGDEYAARSGFSEHNTGLAVDIVSPTSNGDTFDTTEEFRWLNNHAHEYGFILRYPEGKTYLTGYEYESWHYRYLGVELATKVYQSGLTYEEYYAYYLED